MDSTRYIVRRANVDDLSALKMLWERAHLQVLDVEKRLTDFQLIASMEGDLIGAMALQVDGKQGRIHSEAFVRPEDGVDARPLLWERLQTLARNHGLVRLWTRERAAFWSQAGFGEATPESMKKLPVSFGSGHERWLTISLRDESPATISVEQEFEIFQQAQRASTEQLMARARQLKVLVVGVVLLLVAAAVMAALLFLLKQNRGGRSRADLGLVGCRVQELIQFSAVGEFQFEKPAVLVGGAVDEGGIGGEQLVDFDHAAADRGVDIAGCFHRFNDGARVAGLEFATDGWQFDEHDVG
jgi:N-acetylglutamate synthase-like GNAT family acetyltransferase